MMKLTGYAYLPQPQEDPTTWHVPEEVPLKVGDTHIGMARLTQHPDGTVKMQADIAPEAQNAVVPLQALALGLRPGPAWSNPLATREEKLKLRSAIVSEVYACSANEDPRVPPYVLWSDDE